MSNTAFKSSIRRLLYAIFSIGNIPHYPRPKWFHSFRWSFRLYRGTIYLCLAVYIPTVLFNLYSLVIKKDFSVLGNFSSLTRALLLDQLIYFLARHWERYWWAIAPLLFIILLLNLLALWMYHDEKREKKWTKQQEQILEQERQLKEIDKQGGITLREIQKIHDEFEPRLPPPFYETTARAKYLEGLNRQYSSITLPIAPAKGFSLQATFQPLKLRRDPLAAEDLAREERRALLGEPICSDGDPRYRPPLSNARQSRDQLRQSFPIVFADNGNDALKKSPHNRMVILGGPGSGKTTLLKYLIANRARESQVNSALPIPIFISLPDLARSGKTLKEYLSYIAQALIVDDSYANVLWSAIVTGRAFICLDSLVLQPHLCGILQGKQLQGGRDGRVSLNRRSAHLGRSFRRSARPFSALL